jgi:hypothetical protein
MRSATAILDRFLNHAEVIATAGKSHRLRNQASRSDENCPPDRKTAQAVL